MTTLNIEQRVVFQKGIEDYVYVQENGLLDLNEFCCTLSLCFDFDGLQDAPQPRQMFDLLLQVLQEVEGEDQLKQWVLHQRVPEMHSNAHVYPDGFRTLIHVAALVKEGHTWIYNIGCTLMGTPDDDSDPKYYAWAKEEWFFTHQFIDGYHHKFFEFLQRFDAKHALAGGNSAFETLHLAYKDNIGYDDAAKRVAIRNEARNQAVARISSAIQAGFYLEAITLEECLISNCVFNFLRAKNEVAKEASFAELLKKMVRININAPPDIKRMFAGVDAWRSRRNSSIHGFISTLSSELLRSTDEFFAFSKETALAGLLLCDQVNEWYANESARFQQSRFSRKTETPLH